MRLMFALLLAIGTTVFAEEALPDDNSPAWNFHRGPGFDGHVTDTEIVETVPPEGPPVLWTRTLGKGFSGFSGDGNRVYTQYQTLGGQYVVCLDAHTGETVWEYRYAFPYQHVGLYPGPRSTPTLYQDKVYFTGPSGELGCLTAARGKKVWVRNVFEDFEVEPVEFGFSCSPVIVDDTLYLPVGAPGASMVALNPQTGETLWKAGDEPISHVSVYPIRLRGQRVLLTYLRNSLLAFDDRGHILWRKFLSAGYDEHAAWPIYSEPYLWISGPFQAGSELLELTLDPPAAKTVWKKKVLSNDVCSSVLVEGHVYGFDVRDAQSKLHRPSRGEFQCVELLTGEVQWTNGSPNMRRSLSDETDGSEVIGQATVLVADDKLILLNDLGELIVAKVNPLKYEELWRVHLLKGDICWTQPMLLNGCLYARNQTRLVSVLLQSPEASHIPTDRPLMTIDDLPQSEYRDWTQILLPIEPYYSMDAPTVSESWDWFGISHLLLVAGIVLAAIVTGVVRLIDLRSPTQSQNVSGNSRQHIFRNTCWLSWFFAGLLGTTLISQQLDRFIFTWPLSLFVVFQMTLYRTGGRTELTMPSRLLNLVCIVLFLGLSVVYFLLCRRLSLAFEWSFLAAYPAAVPFSLLARWFSKSPRFPRILECVVTVVSWCVYFWTAVGIIVWKYHQ
ncbi:outer membrane protein assembly factor BamB family protein [Thalassoroseus pseudoceratinae]|uniref:outer membrane protein assembly factor BamB family protein n=1 Tax=Thalassoroseus pseudoceratinae TaxID=2713176 RepID=UPI00141FAF00|nr:PQQ-binding-like beta-propeller repeat protein [Thalassoroseus pseudoceratinae]